MEIWQKIITICAGVITLLTLLEKLGVFKTFKKVDNDFSELKKVPIQITALQQNIEHMQDLQQIQNAALLAIIRNDLYQCFKNNRDIGVWTDDEANVQTKLHAVYHDLNGNGEESIWWEKKKFWRIVSNEEFDSLVEARNKNKILTVK